MDWSFGTITVSICLGIIYGAVYGWLFFGVMLMLTALIEGIVGK